MPSDTVMHPRQPGTSRPAAPKGVNDHRILGLARFISRHLPQAGAYWLSHRIASVFHACDRRGRLAVIANNRRILAHLGRPASEADVRRLARSVFRNFGEYLADFFRFERLTREQIARLADIERQDHLEQAFAAGRGVVLITAHLGNWELGGGLVSALGYPLTAVAFPERVGKTNELFQRQRQRRGMSVLSFGAAARGVLETLRNRGIVGMLADRDFTRHDDLIPFFGEPARLPTAPVRLSLHTGAPILPAFLVRGPNRRFTLRFHPPIWPGGGGDADRMRTIIRDALQEEIGRDPAQWFVFEDFWKKGQPHAATAPA